VSGSDIFILSNSNVGEYTTSGATVNASLITGLFTTNALAVSGSDLFIAEANGTIAEYTTSGTLVNPALITGLGQPLAIAADGSDLFVASDSFPVFPDNTIGEYTTSGATVNATLITGLGNNPSALAVVPEPSTWALLFLAFASLSFRSVRAIRTNR
jgi:hypothetical protein